MKKTELSQTVALKNTANIAIKVESFSKCYQIYDNPRDRLLQILAGGRKQYYREFCALKDVSLEIKKVKPSASSAAAVNLRCCR